MDEDLEDRMLSLLPYATQEERLLLLTQLGRHGGARALAELIPIVEGTVKKPASERAAAIQALGKHSSAHELVTRYAQALKDRDLFVQLLALMLLRRWDQHGEATNEVQAWLKGRLKSRSSRKITDFKELPLAIGYFTGIDDLLPLAQLLDRYDEQIDDPVDRLVLEFMWPRKDRQEWVLTGKGQLPDLTGLGEFGHPPGFYLRFDAKVAGIESPDLPPSIDIEVEALDDAMELENAVATLLAKLERRRGRLV